MSIAYWMTEVTVLGLDTAVWKVVDSLLEAGRLLHIPCVHHGGYNETVFINRRGE
jgi:hypothetical protein